MLRKSPVNVVALTIPLLMVMALPTLKASVSPPILTSPIIERTSSSITFVVPIPTVPKVAIPTKVDIPETSKFSTSRPSISPSEPKNLFAVITPVKFPSPTTSRAAFGIVVLIPIFLEV